MAQRSRVSSLASQRALLLTSELGRSIAAKVLGVRPARLDKFLVGKGTISRAESSRLRSGVVAAPRASGLAIKLADAGISERKIRAAITNYVRADSRAQRLTKQKAYALRQDALEAAGIEREDLEEADVYLDA